MKRFLCFSVVFLLIVLLAVPVEAMSYSIIHFPGISYTLETAECDGNVSDGSFGEADEYSDEYNSGKVSISGYKGKWDDDSDGGSGGESGGDSGGESGSGSGGESGSGSGGESGGGSGGESGGGSGEGSGDGAGDSSGGESGGESGGGSGGESGGGSGEGSGDGSVTPNEPTEGNSNMGGNSGSGNNKKGNSGSGKHAGAAVAEGSPAQTDESQTSEPTTVPATEETTAATTETIVQIIAEEDGSGDLTPLLILLIVLIAAALVLIYILLKKLKESNEQTIQNPPIHTAHADIEDTALNAAPPFRPQASAPAEPTVYTAVMPAKPVVVTKSPKAPSTVLQDAVADTEVSPSAAAATAAAAAAVPVYYLVGQTGHFAGQRIPISKQLRFGRGGINDIAYPLDASGISGVHCALIPGKDGVILVDLGSTYGTHLPNGTKLKPNRNYLLKRGDSFCLCNRKQSFRIE